MVIFPNAKINLGLHILRKRSDGFHNIETVFYPVPLTDILEFTYHNNVDFQYINPQISDLRPQLALTRGGKKVVFQMSGLIVEGELQQNLIFKALQLFEDHFGLSFHVHIHLHKKIPMGAGLGGGSADAAFLLKQLWLDHGQPCSLNDLTQLASTIGSDCAFFIRNEPSIATGKGELLQPIPLTLKGYYVVIVKPGVHVATAAAYAGVTPCERNVSISDTVNQPLNEWNQTLFNDFEASVFLKYPEIGVVKDKLLKSGAVYSAMSGSGSAVFGIFKDAFPEASAFPDCFYYCGKLA